MKRFTITVQIRIDKLYIKILKIIKIQVIEYSTLLFHIVVGNQIQVKVIPKLT